MMSSEENTGHNLSSVIRQIANLEKLRADLITTHEARLKGMDSELRELREIMQLHRGALDVEKIKLAETVIQVTGDPRKVRHGSDMDRSSVRANAVTAGLNSIASGNQLREGYIGVKNYSGFGDQREDHKYGYGPRHGTIVFSIGRTAAARKVERFTMEETEAAIYYLNALDLILDAKKVGSAE